MLMESSHEWYVHMRRSRWEIVWTKKGKSPVKLKCALVVTIINRKLMAMHILCRHQKVMNATTDPVSIPQENHNMYTALTPVPLVTIDRAVMSVAPLSTLPQNCPEYCSSTSLELGDVLPQYLRQFWGKAVLHFCCSIVRCPFFGNAHMQ